MKIQKPKLIKLAASGVTGLAFANAVQAATTLTGDGQANNSTVLSTHGSNAAGTPNIALTWDADWDSYASWPGDPGGGVYQHDHALNNPHIILFTPDAGWNVSLTSLDINIWAGGGATNLNWSVTGSSSGSLGSGTFSTADGTITNHAIGITGVGGETLTLSLDQTSGIASYVAIDNLTFDQVAVVPEPSTSALAALGLGAMAMRRRRK